MVKSLVVFSAFIGSAYSYLLQHSRTPVNVALRSSTPSASISSAFVWAVKDHSSTAAAFCTNIRVPAALIGGAALANAFALNKKAEDNNVGWTLASNAYTLSMLFSFGMEFMTVFMATATGVRLIAGGYDPCATSAIAMMVREFEREYVCIRFQFFTGLLSFLAAQSIRVRKELMPVSKTLARAGFFFMLFSIFNIVSYFNSQLVFYGGYFALMRRYFQLNTFRFLGTDGQLSIDDLFRDPFATLGSLSLVVSMVAGAQLIIEKLRKMRQHDDETK